MTNPFTKATKTQSRLRCGIMGPSNSGKTWQALTLANALGKTAVIDTENGSASKYADLFGFDVINLTNHHPDEYAKMLDAAASAGYDSVVVDSLTHAWDATQRLVDDEVIRTRGNSFQIWGKVGQVYNRLMQKIIQCPIHVVATMRSKTEYVLEENDRGKKVPRKVGLAPQVRQGAEYEFDVVLECDHENNVWATKSRCPVLNGQTWKKPKLEIATILKAWLTDGAPIPMVQDEPKAPTAADLGAAFKAATAKGQSKGDLLFHASEACKYAVTGAADIKTDDIAKVIAAWEALP